MFRWPDREAVDAEARAWGERVASARPDLLRLGYFGSYEAAMVYTEAEWQDVVARGDRFARVLSTQVVWIHPRG